ncbi:MAG: hypothetical protein ACYDIA_02330 [Candidatus Humimicrobiaceae bacterium]
MDKYKKILLIIIVIIFTISLLSCSNSKRISELEKTVTDLQKQLSDKENKIKEFQNVTTTTAEETTTSALPKNDDAKLVENTLNNYMDAVGKQDFSEQKNYVAKYALDLVNFKEEENKNSINKEGTFEKEPISNIVITGNTAEAFMSFTEHLVGSDNSKYDLITEGKAILEKINNEWKITDYTRKNHLISESLFIFNDYKFTDKDLEFKITSVLFSLFDKYVVLNLSISNNSDKNLKYYTSDAILIGSDKIQSKAPYYDPAISDILSSAIAKGYIQFNWYYDSANNFSLSTGEIRDTDGQLYSKGFKIDIDLSKTNKY